MPQFPYMLQIQALHLVARLGEHVLDQSAGEAQAAIIADPIGALFAIVAYETTVALAEGEALAEIAIRLGGAVVLLVLYRLIKKKT